MSSDHDHGKTPADRVYPLETSSSTMTNPTSSSLVRDKSDLTMEDNFNDDTDGTDDDDVFLDLTFQNRQQQQQQTGTTQDQSSSNSSTSRQRSPDPLDWLVDEGLSEDALIAMGIDIAEIRAQREIEQRLEMEAKQLEYAKKLQQELDREAQQSTITSSIPTSTSSTILPNNMNIPTSRELPESFNTNNNNNKRAKTIHVHDGNVTNNQQAESSTSAADQTNVFVIDSEDDGLVDLTAETGNSIDNAIPLGCYDSDEDSVDNDDDLIPLGNTNVDYILRQMEIINQRHEAQRRYGITMNPFPESSSFSLAHHTFTPTGFSNRRMNPAIGDPTKRSMTTAQAGDELRKLLETINDEEPPPPESRSGTPDGLKVNLLEHQKIGFQWMTKQELSINKGGMLTDDMGLGKTVQALSIIVSRKSEDHAPPSDMLNMTPMQRAKRPVQSIKVKTTLVICPVSLMEQWAQEVRYKTENLSVYVYHGSRRTNDIYELSKYDVVITSYTMIGGEFTESHVRRGPLACLKFHRVILDEAHTIKNRNTRTAQACYRIEATHRWCLTATPIQNKIEELYSLIHFLQIRPYCDWSTFREEVVSPLRHGKSDVLKKVQVILKAIALRRSKKAQIDGRPILNLPERNVHFTHVDFSDRERQFYDFVDNRVQQSFNNYVEAGTVMQNYSNVLVLLLRLRQACLHPKLTTIELPQQRNDEEHFTENAKSLDKKVVDRLLSGKEELLTVECPICMDTAQEPRIISGCGHILCRECLQTYISGSAATGIVKSCPHCRGELVMDKIISVAKFLEVYAPNPEELSKQEKEEKAAKEEKELEASLGKVQEFVSSKKIDTMLEILAKTREESKGYDKTIVFSQFTSMLDIMEKPLKASGYKFGRYDGSIPVATRTKVLEQFYNDPAMEVLLVSTKCGSLGLNLTMANRVILMDIWWNPALENQAIDRVHRIGQTKDVEVHRIFINNTVEDRILELQRKKQAIADGALGEGTGEKIGRLGLQEMLYLFRGGRVPGSVDSLAGPSRT